jgi:precorrin-6B methylase 1
MIISNILIINQLYYIYSTLSLNKKIITEGTSRVSNMISIVGIGSGNLVEELTIKAYNTLKKSDIGIYPGNFIGEELKELFEDKTMFTGRDITSEKIKNIFHNNRDKNICLMVSGDPALYSGQFNTHLCLDEHIKWFNEHNYNYEMIPGLSSLSILCAKKSIDLTTFSKTQNVFITSIERLRDLKCLNYTELKSILSTYWVTNKDSEYISANQLSYRYYYLQYRGGPYIRPLNELALYSPLSLNKTIIRMF